MNAMNEEKTIAIPYFGKRLADVYRDGIGVYVRMLVKGFLEFSEGINIEIWCYHNNVLNAKKLFEDLEECYADRIRYLDEMDISGRAVSAKLYMMFYKMMAVLGLKDKEQIPRSIERKYPPYPDWLRKRYYNRMLFRSEADWVYILSAPHIECVGVLNKPYILQLHDLFTFTYEKEFSKEFKNIKEYNNSILRNIEKYLKLNAKMVCSCGYTKREQCLKYIPGLDEDKVEIVPFLPMLKQFDKSGICEEKIVEKYELPETYIFYPTQNRTNKNIITLLKALNLLKNNNVFITFVTTGRMKSVDCCEAYVRENNLFENVKEIGTVSDEELFVLYKHAKAVVSTSYVEGSCISGQVLEALSIGDIPVISALNDGIEERLSENGLSLDTADLNWFDRFDYARLADLIIDVISNPSKHIKKQKGLIENFTRETWVDIARRYFQIFESLEESI